MLKWETSGETFPARNQLKLNRCHFWSTRQDIRIFYTPSSNAHQRDSESLRKSISTGRKSHCLGIKKNKRKTKEKLIFWLHFSNTTLITEVAMNWIHSHETYEIVHCRRNPRLWQSRIVTSKQALMEGEKFLRKVLFWEKMWQAGKGRDASKQEYSRLLLQWKDARSVQHLLGTIINARGFSHVTTYLFSFTFSDDFSSQLFT